MISHWLESNGWVGGSGVIGSGWTRHHGRHLGDSEGGNVIDI